MDPALATGTLPREPTLTLLTTPASRAPVLAALLANSQTPAWARDAARSSLAPGDFGVIETVIIRQKLTVDLVGELLADPRPDIRAMIALAYFGASRRELRQFPGALGDAWRHAVRDLRPSKQAKSIAHEITTLFRYMTENYPDDLLEIIAASIGEANATGVYGALPHECWELLALLPAPQKLTLWQRFKSHNSRWILLPHLIGTDSQWLEQILQSGETTADEAIGCLNGLGPRPPIDELAKMLVPRGIDPGRIASLRFAGMWTGEQSDRYRSIAESFRELGQSSDPNVAAVGDAGAPMFTEAQAEAEHREYQQRVRGDR